MQYHYIAAQTDGKIKEGNLEADAPEQALEQLAAIGLRPISVRPVKSFGVESKKLLFGSSITVIDKVFLTKYLSLMLKVGTDLFQAINILIEDFEKPAIKSLLLEVRSTLERGKPFYITFAKYPKIFSPVFVNLIKAGEASGNLEKIFEDLSTSLEKERDLRGKIKAALVYPVILLVASLLVLFFLVAGALPRIADVFETAGVEPPFFSRVVFSVGNFLNEYIVFIILLMVVAVVGGIIFVKKSTTARRLIHHMARRTPLVKGVMRRLALQRFAATLSALMQAGLPILESLEISAEAVGDEELRAAIVRISRERISKGVNVGDAFRREEAFPRVVTNLIAIGERAGHVEEILKTLATFYEGEIDSSIKTLVSFLEPGLLLFIGVTIGTIALSVIVPIYQLVGQF